MANAAPWSGADRAVLALVETDDSASFRGFPNVWVGNLCASDYTSSEAVFLAKAIRGGSEKSLMTALPDRIIVDIFDDQGM